MNVNLTHTDGDTVVQVSRERTASDLTNTLNATIVARDAAVASAVSSAADVVTTTANAIAATTAASEAEASALSIHTLNVATGAVGTSVVYDSGTNTLTVPVGVDGTDGIMASIVAGTNVTVDATDPANPIVSATDTDTVTIVNNTLTSTSTAESLSAAQGKALKDVQDTQQSAIDINTAKISFDSTSSSRLANTSGTNTGDQDLSGLQPLSTDLTNIDALVGNLGFLKKTALNTWVLDTNTYLTSETSHPSDSLDSTDITNIGNLSGVNTGDQDLSGYSVTTHNHDLVYEPIDSTILKDADIGSTVQAYDVDTAKTDVSQTWTAPQSFSVLADNDLTLDFVAESIITCEPTVGGTLNFTNIPTGTTAKSMLVRFKNTANLAIALGTSIEAVAGTATALSTTGVRWITCIGVNGIVSIAKTGDMV